MRYARFIPAAAIAYLAAAAGAAEIVCDGVIGNSGERGETLVRFSAKPCRGMGAVRDRFGSLWDRAGAGQLNRYAADGRLLAAYPVPARAGRWDKITIAGDAIVLFIAERLYTLDVAAAAGTKPTPLDIRCEHISFGAAGGRIACVDGDKRLFLLAIPSGKREAVADLSSLERIDAVELEPGGTIYVKTGRAFRRVVDGTLDAGWSRSPGGERPQRLGGHWFVHGWHGTIKRFDADLRPAPGVVLGGASGHFIGHLPQNAELRNGRGMARLADRLYAVGGLNGIMHLLAWRPEERTMHIVRRIGALPAVGGIGLDRRGRIWAVAGSWEWTDGPAAPLRFGVNTPEPPGIGQAVMLAGGAMVAPAFTWSRPSFYSGTFEKEVRLQRLEKKTCALENGFTGAAVYRREKQLILLVIDAAGAGRAFRIGPDGRYRGEAGAVRLTTAAPVTAWTTLAMQGPDTLLAAGDGHLIAFARDGTDWRETGRRGGWGEGAAGRFGNQISIAADDRRLWVADTARHRVVCLRLADNGLVASFGTADAAGDDLRSLSAPGSIAARGRRAAVFDAGNQRIVKLRLAE